MAALDHKARKNAAIKKIRRVEEVLRRWDPIGVEPGTMAPADEYDSYAPHIVSMVAGGCTVEELAAHLDALASTTIGVGSNPKASATFAAQIIEVLRASNRDEARTALGVMKRAEYQLVLQFPCNSLQEFDAVVALENALVAELSGTLADVDGHDSGSGEANIFILTSEPNETFERARVVVGKVPSLASVLRAAYRKLDGEEYRVLWPPGETRFAVI